MTQAEKFLNEITLFILTQGWKDLAVASRLAEVVECVVSIMDLENDSTRYDFKDGSAIYIRANEIEKDKER